MSLSDFFGPSLIHKIFGANCSFYVKQSTTARVQFLFFRRFLLALAAFSFFGGGLGAGRLFYRVLGFS